MLGAILNKSWRQLPAKQWTYIQQLCADTGYSLEDLLGVMDDRDSWWERVWQQNMIIRIYAYYIVYMYKYLPNPSI